MPETLCCMACLAECAVLFLLPVFVAVTVAMVERLCPAPTSRHWPCSIGHKGLRDRLMCLTCHFACSVVASGLTQAHTFVSSQTPGEQQEAWDAQREALAADYKRKHKAGGAGGRRGSGAPRGGGVKRLTGGVSKRRL